MFSLRPKISAHRIILAGSSLLIASILSVAGYFHTRAFAANLEVYSGHTPKVINKADPIVSAVIYGSPTLDINMIDPASIRLSGAQLRRRGDGRAKMKIRDVNGDGIPDLNFVLLTDELHLSEGSHIASLEAKTFDGRAVIGKHLVEVVNRPLHTESAQDNQQDNNVSNGKPPDVTPDVGSTFTNSAPITINDGPTPPTIATPYPSTITVTGLTGNVSKVSVKLNGLSHTAPDDIDILLVGPTGAKLVIQADSGGFAPTGSVTNITYQLVDAAPACPPDGAGLTNNAVYKPAKFGGTIESFPAPAPVGPYPEPTPCATTTNTFTNTFATLTPNGIWSLYIVDDSFGDVGAISGGWTLTILTTTAANTALSGIVNMADGTPLGGAVMDLSGMTSARTITDASGHYSFDNLATGFYTVSPALANYTFGPISRSFSLTGSRTDAAFTATPDAIQVSNPLDTSEYFVRQQYIDFLGRESDQGGLDFWSSKINACGSDAACIRQERIEVSAAFFSSEEFQQTGSFIYSLYNAGLGRNLSYSEFSADRSQVINGADLDARKAAFAKAFVERREVAQKYLGMTASDGFLDAPLRKIKPNSRTSPSAQRGALIANYNSGQSMSESRSLVLRESIENASFKQSELNEAFVLMQYFGYLRRDADTGGFDFWLDVLTNRVSGNYRSMVCAFITSAEYQRRFSSIISYSNSECR